MALLLLTKCGCIRNFPKIKLCKIYSSSIRQISSKPSNILCPKRNNVIFRRTFIWQFLRKPSSAALKQSDKIPEFYEMIYKNTMSRYVLSAQIMSVGTSLIVAFWVIYNTILENSLHQQKWGNPDQPKPNEDEILIFIASFVLLCVALQTMVYKTPIRIYNYPKKSEYVFVFYGFLPSSTRQVTCKLKDISKVEPSGILPWRDARIEIAQKQTAIVLTHFFRRPADSNIMLGYQKPELEA